MPSCTNPLRRMSKLVRLLRRPRAIQALLACVALLSVAPDALAQCVRWLAVYPPVINEFAMTYDAQRQRVVAFGGQGPDIDGLTNQLWEWDGSLWTNQTPVYGPQVRRSHAMAYDAARRVHVLFGGNTEVAGLVNDTWEYDGTAWRAVGTTNQPSPRENHAMCYDSVRQRVIMFGGSAGSGETWTFDGLNWTLASTTGPSAFEPMMCFDSSRGVAVLVTNNAQVWEWNGSAWAQRTPPTNNPTARAGGAMAFDGIRNVAVLYGGTTGSNETWNWDGNAWTLRQVVAIGNRRGHQLAFDAARGVVMAFGGDAGWATNASLDDAVNTWNGATWTTVAGPLRPIARNGAAFAYDTSRRRLVMYGGNVNNANAPSQEMWEFTTSTGTWASRSGGPPAGMYNQMAFDANRNTCIMVVNGQTWEYNGNTWGLRATTGASNVRWETLGWDPVTGVTRMIGGAPNNNFCDGGNGNITREWDGIAWTQVAGQGDSWPRAGALVFNPVTLSLELLHGKGWGYSPYGERRTCPGGGNGWAVSAGNSLGLIPTAGRAVVRHSSLNQYFGFGGDDVGPSPRLDTTALPIKGPSARHYHSMWYDQQVNKVYLFSGTNNRADMWVLEQYGPSFSPQPQSQTAGLGSTVTFTTTVVNAAPGYSVRWRKNGVNLSNGGRVSGAFTTTLQLSGLVAGDAGQYDCITSSDCGAVTSQAATLTVVDCLAVSITQHPAPASLAPGQTVAFSVTAAGTNPSYRWRRNGVDLVDNTRYTGTGTPTLTITSVANADQGLFTCFVSNACGSQTSNPAELSCRPIVTQQPPASLRLSPGLSISVGVPANAQYSYRWRQNGQNLFNVAGLITGATTRTLTLLSDDSSLAGSYECVLTNSCGTTTSSAVEIPCPADFNGDGGVDGSDVEAFFAVWVTGDTSGDINQDGGVDGADIEAFFTRWADGC